MSLSVGSTLGTYEITGLLGKGGMGEVYRARDTRLKRDVAIKVLPDEFTRDADRVNRFQREAEVVASLNHPNIAAIYDLQEHSGRRFLILELVEGETLAERIAHGPLAVPDALEFARQICEGLELAHEKGIVHRDLKPANVKISPDGKVKVLDFGLAKAIENRPGSATMSQSPTLSLAATNAGVIIGTASYMSPEQARGLEADHRSDVFALGCILYEMLTGEQGFQGETISDVLASVLKADPELNLLPANLNPRIRELLRRCLEKNPKRRWHAVGDLRVEIETALIDPFRSTIQVHSANSQTTPLWRRVAYALALLTLGGGITGLVAWRWKPVAAAPIVTRFSIPFDGLSTIVNRTALALSPDGGSLVYVSNRSLLLRRMGEAEAKLIPGSESEGGVLSPAFSPDGSSIAYFAADDQSIRRIAVTGGAPISLCHTGSPWGLSWDDSGILFSQGPGIFRVNANGGQPEKIITAGAREFLFFPQMLPDGKTVLYSLATGGDPDRYEKGKIVVQSIGSTERRIIMENATAGSYVPGGYLIYPFSGTIRAVSFDLKRLAVDGGAVPVLEGIRRTTGQGVPQLAFSRNGSLAYLPGPAVQGTSNQVPGLVDRDGHTTPLKVPPGIYNSLRASPDGKRVAYESNDGKETQISIYDLPGSTATRRLTFGGKSRFPVWSPDSKWIAFQSDREGDSAIFRQLADGTGTAERLTKPEAGQSHRPDSWSPNGETLLFESADGRGNALMLLSLHDRKTAPFGDVRNSNPLDAAFSPDGRWVAYTRLEELSKSVVYVQPLPATGAIYQLTRQGDPHSPLWLKNGKEFFYAAGPQLNSMVSVHFEPGPVFGTPTPVFGGANNNSPQTTRIFDITPDGKYILTTVDPVQDQAAPEKLQINIVLNWFDELKRRMSALR